MVRTSPPLPITIPVPSRSLPRVATLRASGSARVSIFTMAAKKASGSIAVGVLESASAAGPIAGNAAKAMTNNAPSKRRGSCAQAGIATMATSGSKGAA